MESDNELKAAVDDLREAIETLSAQVAELRTLATVEPTAWSRPDSVGSWARRFGVSQTTIRRWFSADAVRNKRVGKLFMVDTRDLPMIPSTAGPIELS